LKYFSEEVDNNGYLKTNFIDKIEEEVIAD
jgi:hypothetical protein